MSGPDRPSVAWVMFGFRGRIARQSYILGQLLVLSLFAFVVARLLAVRGDESATLFWGLVMLALLAAAVFSSFAMTFKRLHDITLPGPLAILLFVPTVNVIMVVALMVIPSTPHRNRYGPPPFAPPRRDG